MRVGFIGLGHMGRHMARNLVKGGHDLIVFDIRREAAEEALSLGASWADSPAGVAGTPGNWSEPPPELAQFLDGA